MQFLKNGPDIPERLLRAHEEGRVVFFCGAGISYPARLPGFSGLVNRLFETLGVTPNGIEQTAIKAKHFDTAIGLLENDIVGGREKVRGALATILTPDLTAKGATDTHKALLTLGSNRDGRFRLITTNFDRLFEEVIQRDSLDVKRFEAPLLPVPKKKWDGLVYLHGLISPNPKPDQLDRLVITSGDFGLAYLTERWAARFVSELFRTYTVCFIGYSIDDPVLRYMMDALAADRLLGESPPEMFAFGSSTKAKEETQKNEWKAKNVTPILYRESKTHSHLHETLRRWAEIYRDGVSGKERIVAETAIALPMASTRQDDFVGRLLWAVSEPNGLPAKRFAEFDPVPPFEWLEAFCENRYKHDDLCRFGILPLIEADDDLEFSLARRPTPYRLAPWMELVEPERHHTRMDEVMNQLAGWLTRHLDDPRLILWLAERGGILHERFRQMIEWRLDELTKLKTSGNYAELARLRTNAPNSIPRPSMRILWRLILCGRVKPPSSAHDLYDWVEWVKRDGLTPTLRMELRDNLAPYVILRKPVRWVFEQDLPSNPESIKELVDWEIVLSVNHPESVLAQLHHSTLWEAALPELLPDFSMLLQDAFDLMRELGGADDKSDSSYLNHPSIIGHTQNYSLRTWTVLVNLCRDSWIATAGINPELARSAAERWWMTPYPIFKRLAFFAAAQEGCISTQRSLGWLLTNDGWWLWSPETKREAIRLLVAIVPHILNAGDLQPLEIAILAGPPREMFSADLDSDHWEKLVERAVWLRLSKIRSTGTLLGPSAALRLDEISSLHPHWRVAEDERDEFAIWMGGVGFEGESEEESILPLPRRRRELIKWLTDNPKSDIWHKDGWRNRCRTNFSTTTCALYALARNGTWIADRWREALQVWAETAILKRSWRYGAVILVHAPSEIFQELSDPISYWLCELAKTREGHEDLFLKFCLRILDLEYEDREPSGNPVMDAINHPVGHVTEGLLRWWYRRPLEDHQGLPDEIKSTFSNICDTRTPKFRHGRVILSSHVIALYRVDPEWASTYLLPLFDWKHSEDDAHAAWTGFLGSPRPYLPFIEAIKAPFLNTVDHYASLGGYDEQYAALLTLVALDPGSMLSVSELRKAFSLLPTSGLQDSARYLARLVEGMGDKRESYWKNRVSPFLRSIWPKSRDQLTQQLSDNMALLCIAAGEAFPSAFEELRHCLTPMQGSYFLIHQLKESGICEQFPAEALSFLDLILCTDQLRRSNDLKEGLEALKSADPQIASDPRFRRLDELARR